MGDDICLPGLYSSGLTGLKTSGSRGALSRADGYRVSGVHGSFGCQVCGFSDFLWVSLFRWEGQLWSVA